MKKNRSKEDRYLLSGRNGKVALKLLNDITNILDKYHVNYWLDFGTLLGIIREERLLPWDTDMDISIFEEDKDILKEKVLPAIEQLRCHTHILKFEKDEGIVKKGNIRVFKVHKRWFLFSRPYVRLDIFVMYRNQKHLYWNEFKELHSLPQNLVSEFLMIDFNGKKYRVPKNYDNYLTYHYGDWQIPNPSYNPRQDNKRTLAK